ncbi:DUF2163 domain-containing protein [Marinicauda algicola]|jgi:hypothetical protein|uniref:DUF2163 domain-containing protein n=1 Tax=Marinicauda algicola TaxID=2029849 RepID=A0A4S2H5E5_9PROT|nr:DUF2163 domain-containing protein [Marinicauda algicola]TGY90648.1 DUF2163 domain-containing protein [Marinicauda algicola]
MKSVSAALAAHLAGPVTTLATCWRITRVDGQEFFFTDHDRDLVFEGHVYKARSGYSRTAIANDASLSVDNLDVEGVFDSEAISEKELRAGLFDQAEVRIFLVNWADPSMGALRMRRGWFGEVVLTEQGVFRTELRGMTQALSQRIGELYSPECRADLGDHRCKVPIHPPVVARETAYALGDHVRVATGSGSGSEVYEDRIYACVVAGTTAPDQPAYDTTVGQQTADGSAVFEAMEAWSRAGAVMSVVDRAIFTASIDEPRAVDGWFAGGVLTWESGANAGRSIEVKGWTQATGQIELFLPMGYVIEIGDLFRIHPGCDKRLDTCIARFANVLNFRGEPYVPGQDAMMSYPDAR